MSFELTPIPVNDDIPDAVASGSHLLSPPSVLGAHLRRRCRHPRRRAHLADAVDIITPTGAPTLPRNERGVHLVAALPGKEIAYCVRHLRRTHVVRDDPYRYLPTLGEMDTYLIS